MSKMHKIAQTTLGLLVALTLLMTESAVTTAQPAAGSVQPVAMPAQGESQAGTDSMYAYVIFDGVEMRVTPGQVVGKGTVIYDGKGCQFGKVGMGIRSVNGSPAGGYVGLAMTKDCTLYVKEVGLGYASYIAHVPPRGRPTLPVSPKK